MNGSHHSDGQPPPVVASHMVLNGGGGSFSQFFSGLDEWVENFGEPLDRARRELAPESEMIMNEFMPFMSDWCAESELNGCPDWTLSSSQGTKINRKTLGWNAAAASFAYAFGRMAELGYKYVGADQLVSGPWPDNEPAVTSLDWDTGEPNAKYWSVRMLAEGLGAGEKRLYNTTVGAVRGVAWTTLADAAISCSAAEYLRDQGVMASAQDCLASVQDDALINYALWA